MENNDTIEITVYKDARWNYYTGLITIGLEPPSDSPICFNVSTASVANPNESEDIYVYYQGTKASPDEFKHQIRFFNNNLKTNIPDDAVYTKILHFLSPSTGWSPIAPVKVKITFSKKPQIDFTEE